MYEHIEMIDALDSQIVALLDLLQMTEDSVDIQSVKTAAEMVMTMHIEIMKEINAIIHDASGGKK